MITKTGSKEVSKVAKLTQRQKQFCDEYVLCQNAYQAAIRAGYAQTTSKADSSKWLEKTGHREYIEKRLAAKDAKLIAKQDEVLETLTRILRRTETETVVVMQKTTHAFYDDNGKKVIETKETPMLVSVPTKISDVNKAAELLGKTYGLYTDRLDLTADIVLDFAGDAPDGD